MVRKHFTEQWELRMKEQIKLPKELLQKLMVKCYKMVETNRHYRELVIVDDLNRYGFNLYENQLCIIIENGFLKTMWRRNENSPKTSDGSKVDNVRYEFTVWKKSE